MRDLPKQDRERARVLVKKLMQNEILLDPVHLAHVNKTEIEFNTDFAFDVSCSNLVERFECKRSTETEKYTKADVELVMTLIRELIDERPPNGDRRITALLQLLTRSRSKKIPSSNEAVKRQRTIATVVAIRAKRREAIAAARVHDLRHGLCSLRLQAGESLHGNFWSPAMLHQHHKLDESSTERNSETCSSELLRSGMRKLPRVFRTSLPKNRVFTCLDRGNPHKFWRNGHMAGKCRNRTYQPPCEGLNGFEDRANHQIRTLPSGRRSGCGATDGRTFVGWIKLFFYTERAKQSARDIAV